MRLFIGVAMTAPACCAAIDVRMRSHPRKFDEVVHEQMRRRRRRHRQAETAAHSLFAAEHPGLKLI
jgi:hypothetical protein